MKPFFELLKITETLVVEMFYYIQIHPGLFESGSQKSQHKFDHRWLGQPALKLFLFVLGLKGQRFLPQKVTIYWWYPDLGMFDIQLSKPTVQTGPNRLSLVFSFVFYIVEVFTFVPS